MKSEARIETTQRLPLQAAPVRRQVVNSPVAADSGVEASDNDHNTDTENDKFFVKIT
jgi:hypothetical protein